MTKQHRETLIWYRASHQERERLLDFGLVDKSQYVTLLRQLRKKYAIKDFKFSEDWESNYFEVQALLGQEIDKLQNRVIALSQENNRLKAENWQLKHRKRR